MKAFAYDKIKVAKMMHFVFDRVENIMVKGENATYQHFLTILKCFQIKASYTGALKIMTVALKIMTVLLRLNIFGAHGIKGCNRQYCLEIIE